MTITQRPQRSWFSRQSLPIQVGLIIFGVTALLILVTIFFNIATFVGDDDDPDLANAPLATPTIAMRPTATIAASPTFEATPSPTDEPSTEPPATTTGPAPITDVAAVEEVYAQAAESLKQLGMVYHVTITLTSEGGPYAEEGTIEHWVDANQNVSRTEVDTTFTAVPEPAGFDLTRITVEGMDYAVYRRADQRTDVLPSDTCYGGNEAVSLVLGCPGALEESTTTIEQGEYEGQPAVLLVKSGTSRGSDFQTTFISRLYLDADTYLPIARETELLSDDSKRESYRRLESYEHEFIPHDALPSDFFSTVALAEEQIEAVEGSYPIYWLGTSFEPGADLRPVVLGAASPPSPASQVDNEHDLQLSYRMAEPQFMFSGAVQSEIIVQIWSPEAWHAEWDAAVRDNWKAQDCQVQHTNQLPAGQATIFMGTGGINVPSGPAYGIATVPPVPEAECGNVEYTRYETIVDLGESVLFIWLPEESTYRSQAGLEAIVQGLEPRS